MHLVPVDLLCSCWILQIYIVITQIKWKTDEENSDTIFLFVCHLHICILILIYLIDFNNYIF